MDFDKWWDNTIFAASQSGRAQARSAFDNAIKIERERCANICEEMAAESYPDGFALDSLNFASVKIRSGE